MISATADIASNFEGPEVANSSGGLFELLVDGVVVTSYDFGFIYANTSERAIMAANFTVATGGMHEVRIRVTRPYLAAPMQFLDNIVLAGVPEVTPSGGDPGPAPTDEPPTGRADTALGERQHNLGSFGPRSTVALR